MASFRDKLGLFLFIIIAIFPLAIWAEMEPLSFRFSDFVSTFASLGQISALVGICLFALALVFSSRQKILDRNLGGLNLVYRYHHLFGGLSFVLLLFHPLFLVAKYSGGSLKEGALFLLPGLNWPNNLGIISLFLMEVLLVITFFARLKYNTWKSTHLYMGVVFLIAVLHMLLVQSDVSRSLVLRYYVLSVSLLGVLSYLYNLVLREKISALEYEVETVKKIGNNIVEITLSPLKEKLDFDAGQFIFVKFFDKGVSKEAHPFTISSAPSEKNIRLSVKSLGDFTSVLNNIKRGSKAKVEGPYGKFVYKGFEDKEQIWIAGGIGITPFLSMIRNKIKNQVILYYSVKESDAAFIEELREISSKDKNFKFIPFYSSKRGHLTAETIKKEVNVEDKDIFICGPTAMINSLRGQFIDLGIKADKIHSEEFSL